MIGFGMRIDRSVDEHPEKTFGALLRRVCDVGWADCPFGPHDGRPVFLRHDC